MSLSHFCNIIYYCEYCEVLLFSASFICVIIKYFKKFIIILCVAFLILLGRVELLLAAVPLIIYLHLSVLLHQTICVVMIFWCVVVVHVIFNGVYFNFFGLDITETD